MNFLEAKARREMGIAQQLSFVIRESSDVVLFHCN